MNSRMHQNHGKKNVLNRSFKPLEQFETWLKLTFGLGAHALTSTIVAYTEPVYTQRPAAPASSHLTCMSEANGCRCILYCAESCAVPRSWISGSRKAPKGLCTAQSCVENLHIGTGHRSLFWAAT
jgi:hypothetical protein